ncbi:hypothetical protein PV10_08702 [Exophiala mesophila]|uniref:Elongator complex protein 6 n=1 Tax=Exophiala mesophila TaxID=212818 RepID=A0A0D1ZQQ7_EXOME|nr:uncharacterized protein PV10_08702 [Exophiala mesophila]KIV89098.1 hypothetical protein PV10_08702 [Exophiala mesophila]
MPIAAPLPQAIVPYLRSSISTPSSTHTQTLVTSTLSTPSLWLLLRLAYVSIYGIEDQGHNQRRRQPSGPVAIGGNSRDGHNLGESEGTNVVIVSFVRDYLTWCEMGKKLGLDFPALVKAKRLFYVDGLRRGSAPSTPHPTMSPGSQEQGTTALKSLALNDITATVNQVLRSASSSSTDRADNRTSSSTVQRIPAAAATAGPRPPTATSVSSSAPTVILDGLDFVLASQPSTTPLSLNALVSAVRLQSLATIVTAQADSPLLHNAMSPLETDHAHLVTSLAHQSDWVLQLRGLDTGSANDVSGVVRASRGGQSEDQPSDLADGEWLYHIKGDGTVRVWGRGELN